MALLLETSTHSFAQDQNKSDQRVIINSSEVVIDVVVRDKKGKPVKNLTESDFQVFEDGVEQNVSSFQSIVDNIVDNSQLDERPDKHNKNKTQTPTDNLTFGNEIVALVFDRLSPDARARARLASSAYVNNISNNRSFVGIFAIDQSLIPVQQFTSNKLLMQQAVERVGKMSSATYHLATEMDRSKMGSVGQVASEGQIGLDREGPITNSPSIGLDAVSQSNAVAARMGKTSLEIFERLERDQQGYATTNALLAISNAMQTIQGRKKIIFFSEGIAIPPTVQGQFRSVINTANRAAVSIYTIDAAGLRAESNRAETRREVNTLAAKQMERASSGKEDISGQPLTRDLERNENILTLNPESGLGQLADQTGGFFINDTNNFNDRLKQIDEDSHFYYLLNYIPQNQNYDGSFRNVEVHIKRTGLNIQFRKGYFAIKAADAFPVLPYEMHSLALANNSSPRDELSIRTASFVFPKTDSPAVVPVLAEIPLRFVTFSGNQEKKQFATNFTTVILIKDAKQQIVKKFSGQYLLNGSLEKLDQVRKTEVLFYRSVKLTEGSYTVQTIVDDALGNKVSIKNQKIIVPDEAEEKLKVSNIVFIKRAEQLKDTENDLSNPFQIGQMLIYPLLDEKVRKDSNKQLGFLLDIISSKGKLSTPRLELNLLQNGHLVANIPVDLPKSDINGRIQFIGALPLERIPVGSYELKATVHNDNESVTRSNFFTLD
jgi:VWFA-related protein